jgi:hypothetical protein
MRPEFETFLARLYTDAQLRARFLANPRAEAERHCMTVEESAALERIDRAGLELSARSFAHKRALKASSKRARSWLAGLAETVRRKVGLYPPAHLCWRLLPKPVV